jgi:hypothetical protein
LTADIVLAVARRLFICVRRGWFFCHVLSADKGWASPASDTSTAAKLRCLREFNTGFSAMPAVDPILPPQKGLLPRSNAAVSPAAIGMNQN